MHSVYKTTLYTLNMLLLTRYAENFSIEENKRQRTDLKKVGFRLVQFVSPVPRNSNAST